MSDTLRNAAQQALEAIERYQVKRQDFDWFADEITALRAALAEPVQEPVAWMDIDSDGQRLAVRQWSDGNREEVPLYAAPPQRKPLRAEPHVWVCPEAPDTHRYDKPGHCEDCGKTLIQMAEPVQEPVEWLPLTDAQLRAMFEIGEQE